MEPGYWKDYFSFSKNERRSVIILLVLIVVVAMLPLFFSRKFTPPVVDENLQALLYSDKKGDSASLVSDNVIARDTQSLQTELFYFDPNKLDADGFSKLGLRAKTIQTILNYRSKGGYFNKPEDIRKIYGLTTAEADRLISYVQIENLNAKSGSNKMEAAQALENMNPVHSIDINTATAEAFESLPGIGDVLSKRIVKFRTSIHGFQSIEDIKRTYGLPDSTYQKILPYLTISDYKE